MRPRREGARARGTLSRVENRGRAVCRRERGAPEGWPMHALRGVLLDVDGTLVDSNDAHAHAWVAAFAEAGVEVPFDRVRRLIGKGGDKLLPEASGIDPESAQGK